MDEEPTKGLHYVSVIGPAGELRVFRREASKLSAWVLYERDGVLHVARRDAAAEETAQDADEQAERLLQNINWALRLSGQTPLTNLTCGGSFYVAEDGIEHRTIFAETVGWVFEVSPAHMQLSTEPDLMPERVEALATLSDDDEVQTIIRLFEAEGDHLGTLYNILERVRAALACDIPRDWITKSNLRRLEHTANDHRAGGLTARHHASKTEPPASPMSLEEAREHVRRILDEFIRRMAAMKREQQASARG